MNYPNEQPKQEVFSTDAQAEATGSRAPSVPNQQAEEVDGGTRGEAGRGESEASVDSVVGSFIGGKKARAEKYLKIIHKMLYDSNGDYDYADNTLEGIAECVEQCGYISDRQVEAVDNIKNKPSQFYGRY